MRAPLTPYELVDGVERNRAHPTTFNIPSLEQKRMIGPGDFVKVGFVLKRQKGNVTVERIWLEVTAVLDDVIVGTIANTPEYLDAKFGDVVRGERRHVLQIHQPKKRTLQ